MDDHLHGLRKVRNLARVSMSSALVHSNQMCCSCHTVLALIRPDCWETEVDSYLLNPYLGVSFDVGLSYFYTIPLLTAYHIKKFISWVNPPAFHDSLNPSKVPQIPSKHVATTKCYHPLFDGQTPAVAGLA